MNPILTIEHAAKSFGGNQVLKDTEKDPDYAALAKAATDKAIAELFAAGIPVVYLKDGHLRRRFPDGSEEDVSDEELREVSGGILP